MRRYVQTLRFACCLGFLQKKKNIFLENTRSIESKASPTLSFTCIGATATSSRSQKMYKFVMNIQQHCCGCSLSVFRASSIFFSPRKVIGRIRRSEERRGFWVVGAIWAIRVQLWGRRQSSGVRWRVRWVRYGGDLPAGLHCEASTAAPRSPWTDACWPWTLSEASAGVWPAHWTAACRGRPRAVVGCRETHCGSQANLIKTKLFERITS